VTALLAAHLHETPPRPRSIWPQVPPAIDLLLFSLLAKDPGYRPSIPQIRAAIASVRAPTTATGRGWRAATSLVGEKSRHVPHIKSAAALGIAVIVGIVIGTTANGSRSRSDVPIEPQPRAPIVVPILIDAGVGTPALSERPAPTIAIDASVAPTDTGDPTSVTKDTNTSSIAERSRPSPPRPVGPGTLRVVSKPACEIAIDGKPTGLRTPQTEIRLAAGRHKITLINEGYGIKESFLIEIKANQIDTEIKDFSDHFNDRDVNPYVKPAEKPLKKKPVDLNSPQPPQ
jgi:hypothetical protein